MTEPKDIIAALAKLDPNTDAHWTHEGLPSLPALKNTLGHVSRKEVTDVAPLFTRERASKGLAPDSVEAAPEPKPAAPDEVAPKVVDVDDREDEITTDKPAEPEVDIEAVRARREELDEELKTALEAKEVAHKRVLEIEKERDALVVIEEKKQDKFHEAFAGFAAAQQADRERRAEAAKKLKELKAVGLLESQAPIDQAMARPNAQFKQRPKY